MGREKRIADRRAKDTLQTPAETLAPRREASVAGPDSAANAPVIAPAGQTGTARALVQILLLYLGPTAIMVLIGKVLLHL